MNKNNVSIIVNNELNRLSCLKSNFVKKTENKYYDSNHMIEVEIVEKKVGNVVEAHTEVLNCSDISVEAEQISSSFIEIEKKGKLKWFDDNKYRVHFCRNTWLGEGQWQTSNLRDLGLYQTYNMHQHNNYISFSSIGSQTTSKFYPLLLIEDLECKEIHFFELCPRGSWYIEICTEYNDNKEETLYVFLSGTYEKNDGWYKELLPKEKYTTEKVLYGTVAGGFEEAIAELMKYKRNSTKVKFENDIPLVCFNDYMNCCWAMPSYKKTIPLIDKAAELGVEVFCIDDGWQVSNLDNETPCIGDWAVGENIFSPMTLEDIISYINSKGMKCGIWLEIEGVQKGSQGYSDLDNYLLKRRGNIIGSPKSFYDFTSKCVQDRIENVIDILYEKGIRYIKNDYNQTVGIGCDGDSSLSEALRKNMSSFCSFIDKIQEKYPDLIIENCGSGAMRCDSETLSHFQLQSTSDQELYSCNPSIICGSLSYMQPEKAGIWSYPYPVRFEDRFEYSVSDADYSGGEETVFNMVNSMMGVMYLSGRIDMCDSLNEKLISEAINVYKSIRADYALSYPIYPNGTFRIGDEGILTLGLYVPSKSIVYLAFWKKNTENTSITVDLSKYGNVKNAYKLYPSLDEYKMDFNGNNITVQFPQGNCAMLTKIEL